MWFKFMNSKFFTVLVSSAVSILIFILSQNLFAKHERDKIIKEELSIRPTYEYVDKQDENIKDALIQHIDESKKADENLMDYIKSMDAKLDILLRPRR